MPRKGDRVGFNGRCQVCKHPDRARIEFLIARGAARKSLGAKFGLVGDAVARHWQLHVPDTVKAAVMIQVLKPGETIEKLLDDENIGLLENLQKIRATLFLQFDAAAEVGDRVGVAVLSSRLHDNLRLAAAKTGELQAHAPKTSITNVVLSPAYLELRGRLLMALRKHPDAMRDVAEAFRAVEQQTGLLGPVVESTPRIVNEEPSAA